MSQADAPPVTFNEGSVEAGGLRIRYLEAGRGPALVVLRGAGDPGLGRAYELLAQRRRVIALDVPGAGESTVDGASQSTREAAQAMRGTIAAIGLERYALLGVSAGVRLAAWLAIEATDQAEALVLVAPDVDLAGDPELEAALRTLEVPTLVLFGTEDRVVAPELGRVYNEIMPRCHFVLVYDAGHSIAQDRPEAVASVVGDFVERKSQFVHSAASSVLNP